MPGPIGAILTARSSPHPNVIRGEPGMSTTPTLDEFRAEVTAFLDRHSERKSGAQASAWGEGDDDVAMFEEVEPEIERGRLPGGQAWRGPPLQPPPPRKPPPPPGRGA